MVNPEEKGRIRISIVGKVNSKGYTLIELIVVVVLIGLMLFIAMPRVREAILQDNLKSAVRRITGMASELRTGAIGDFMDKVLVFDLTNEQYWTYSVDMTPEKKAAQKKGAIGIPVGVHIEDIQQSGQDRKIDGEVTVSFSRRGYVQPTVIHLVQDDRHCTVVMQPFLSIIQVFERYVDYDETTLAGS
jgi:prepilin-type N-terminal cleavage/methylation domain-containing protein